MDHPTPTAREQMVAIAAQRAMYSTQPEVRTMQAMYFKQDSQRKRGPPHAEHKRWDHTAGCPRGTGHEF